jgi:hypothetical protein
VSILRRLIICLAFLALLAACLGTAGTVWAKDNEEDSLDPGPPPKGMAVKVFKHPVKGEAKGLDRVDSTLIYHGDPSDDSTQYGYSGIRWQYTSKIPYWVNTNYNTRTSKGLTKNEAISSIDLSFKTWTAAKSTLGYSNAGPTSAKAPKLDGKNVVGWKALQLGYIAVTYVWYYTATGYIAEFDMLFNDAYAWDYTVPLYNSTGSYVDPYNLGISNAFDLRNIGTHEAGHTLMLDDIYDDTGTDTREKLLTAYGYGSYRELIKDTLQAGDYLGVNSIYP